MIRHLIAFTLLGITCLLAPSTSLAAENAPTTMATPQPLSVTPPASPHDLRKEAAKAPVRIKLVDINRASKKELRSLQGISDAMADKIIAGRPYNSKAAIVTNGAVPEGIYIAIRKQIVVR